MMGRTSNRRQFLLSTFGVAACSSARLPAPGASPTRAPRSLAEIEASVGGRVAAYMSEGGAGPAALQAAHAEIARLVTQELMRRS